MYTCMIYVPLYICIYVYMYICIYVYTYICIYVYMKICICMHTEEEAVGPAFWQPTIFSDSVCFEWLCVGFCVSWSLVWCACVRVFVSNYNISSELFQTRRSVYKHRVCLSTLRFGIPCFQCFEFVGFARCLLCLLYDN